MSSGCGDVLSLEDLKTAKKHQLFEAEVITGKQGGVAGGADIDYATNQVTGQTQKTLPAVLRDAGFRPAPFTFDTGGTLNVGDADLAVLWPGPAGDGQYYSWHGAFPKTIPASSTPAGTGGISDTAWKPIGDIGLRADLLNHGDEMVGMTNGGVLKDVITYVTPEQFGAIGDGTIHPLSDRFGTLSAAQAVYPHVTALTQTIDWAACQAAENYARGVSKVVCREFATYHFGRDGLLIGQYSRWQGAPIVSQGIRNTAFKKTAPSTTPVFQQDYIIRVNTLQNDNPAGVFYYKDGVSVQGLRLFYDVPRRTAVKGTNTICLHMGDMIKGRVDISVWGAEYGVYTWAAWGNEGNIRIDSCHKGFFSVPHLGDNERAGSGTITSNHFNIECDVTPFPITVGRDSYSHYTGYFEGSVSTDGNYDSANETACGITIIDGSTGCTFSMGIEKWQGVHVTKVGSQAAETSFRFGWFTDDHYKMSTGNDGSDASLRAITSTSAQRIQLPAAQRAYINVLSGAGACSFTLQDTGWYMGNVFSETSSTRYLVNLQNTASILTFVGGSTGFTPEVGAAPVAFSVTEAMKKQVEVYGCRNMDIWCAPSTAYRLIGRNRWVQTTKRSVTGVADANGQYADFSSPNATYTVSELGGLVTNLGLTGSAITNAPSTFSMNGNAMRVGSTYIPGTLLTFQAWVYLTQP